MRWTMRTSRSDSLVNDCESTDGAVLICITVSPGRSNGIGKARWFQPSPMLCHNRKIH